MAEESQFVVEAMQVLHALQNGQASQLSPFLFEKAIESLGPGDPQICGPLKRCLISEDDLNVRVKVLQLISDTGRGWADLFGAAFANEIVLSIADSNPLCAAYACTAVQSWEPGGQVSTPLLLWGKRHLPGLWEPTNVNPTQMPPVPKMIEELASYSQNLQQRRELNNSDPSLDNSIRLWGKFRAIMRAAVKKA